MRSATPMRSATLPDGQSRDKDTSRKSIVGVHQTGATSTSDRSGWGPCWWPGSPGCPRHRPPPGRVVGAAIFGRLGLAHQLRTGVGEVGLPVRRRRPVGWLGRPAAPFLLGLIGGFLLFVFWPFRPRPVPSSAARRAQAASRFWFSASRRAISAGSACGSPSAASAASAAAVNAAMSAASFARRACAQSHGSGLRPARGQAPRNERIFAALASIRGPATDTVRAATPPSRAPAAALRETPPRTPPYWSGETSRSCRGRDACGRR
jgi:hypothetical protein